MKYYVAADVHGFYTILHDTLEREGCFSDPEPHRLILLGDCFDRGCEVEEMQRFLLELLEKDELILIRGNHEDLFVDLVTVDRGLPVRHHVSNGTYGTALQLTGFSAAEARRHNRAFAAAARQTPYYKRIIPAAVDYFETEHYVFTHGWIPCFETGEGCEYDPDWRNADAERWRDARWIHGMEAAQTCREEGKTILCGHWHCSYGHAVLEKAGPEFGPGADFSPYRAPGVIALDACTALSGMINVITLED